jgi:hypothetical protein
LRFFAPWRLGVSGFDFTTLGIRRVAQTRRYLACLRHALAKFSAICAAIEPGLGPTSGAHIPPPNVGTYAPPVLVFALSDTRHLAPALQNLTRMVACILRMELAADGNPNCALVMLVSQLAKVT